MGNSDSYRALLTEREREIISGSADVSDQYRYQTVSRIRRRLEKGLKADLQALDAHGGLLDDFYEIVDEHEPEVEQ